MEVLNCLFNFLILQIRITNGTFDYDLLKTARNESALNYNANR